MRLIFLKMDVEETWQHKQARKRRYVQLEEFSFLLNNLSISLNGLSKARDIWLAEQFTIELSVMLITALENLSKVILTHHVVPITASGLQG